MRFFEVAAPKREVVATKRFVKDLTKVLKTHPEAQENLREFLNFRMTATPNESFGKKDYPFSNGDLRGYRHWHMVFGQEILIYEIAGNQIRLYAIVDHKAFDGVTQVLSNFLKTEKSFMPFSLPENKDALELTPAQKADVEALLYDMTTDDAEILRAALRGNFSGLVEFTRLVIDHPNWSDVEKDNALANAFGGSKGLQAAIRDVMKKVGLRESVEVIPVLYHGTSPESAESLMTNGWAPNSGSVGGNMGQKRFLYLTNEPENARWFAQEKGSDTVIAVRNIPKSYLRVDPEDGIGDTVDDELRQRVGNVVLTRPLGPEHFKADLSESRAFNHENPYSGSRMPVYVNPTKAEMQGIFRRGEHGPYIRGILNGDDLYAWDGGRATHYSICKDLGVGLGDVYGFQITPHDGVVYLYNKGLHPEEGVEEKVLAALKAHPSLRGLKISSKPWRNA